MKRDSKIESSKLICISINMEKTGANIKQLIKDSGYTLKDIMTMTGVSTEQAVYKWYSGKSLPTIETLLVLCRILGLTITDLLIIEDGPVAKGEELYKLDYQSNHMLQRFYH